MLYALPIVPLFQQYGFNGTKDPETGAGQRFPCFCTPLVFAETYRRTRQWLGSIQSFVNEYRPGLSNNLDSRAASILQGSGMYEVPSRMNHVVDTARSDSLLRAAPEMHDWQ
eukprot:COSAG02_NODE_595_length_19813_cov_12.215380_10_plen_112_part_00